MFIERFGRARSPAFACSAEGSLRGGVSLVCTGFQEGLSRIGGALGKQEQQAGLRMKKIGWLLRSLRWLLQAWPSLRNLRAFSPCSRSALVQSPCGLP